MLNVKLKFAVPVVSGFAVLVVAVYPAPTLLKSA